MGAKTYICTQAQENHWISPLKQNASKNTVTRGSKRERNRKFIAKEEKRHECSRSSQMRECANKLKMDSIRNYTKFCSNVCMSCCRSAVRSVGRYGFHAAQDENESDNYEYWVSRCHFYYLLSLSLETIGRLTRYPTIILFFLLALKFPIHFSSCFFLLCFCSTLKNIISNLLRCSFHRFINLLLHRNRLACESQRNR